MKTPDYPLRNHREQLDDINQRFLLSVDKWYRQFAGFSSRISDASENQTEIDVRVSPSARLSVEEIVDRVRNAHLKYHSWLSDDTCFLIKVYALPKGEVGGLINPSGKSGQVVEEELNRISVSMDQANRCVEEGRVPYRLYVGRFGYPAIECIAENPTGMLN